MSGNDHDIKVLNSLIEALIDCSDGYAEAAQEAKEPRYSQWLDSRASQYLETVESLKSEVRSRGGSPEDNGSILAKASRAFSGFKQAVLGSQESVSDMVQNSETQVLSRFEKAAGDQKLSATTRDTVRRALERLPLTETDLEQLSATQGHS